MTELALTPVLAHAGLILTVLASVLHVLIFYMESIAWEGALARKTFGGTPEEARPHAFYAYNQGFYNLFLAVQGLLGAALVWAGSGYAAVAGVALAAFATASMLAAAIALAAKSPAHRGAAAKQGALPLLALVALGLAFLI